MTPGRISHHPEARTGADARIPPLSMNKLPLVPRPLA
jgi:hypothetical protein